MADQTTLEQNVKELVSTFAQCYILHCFFDFTEIFRTPIPSSAYAAFQPTDSTSQALHPPKDGKALLARVAFLLRVIEPLAPIVDVEYHFRKILCE